MRGPVMDAAWRTILWQQFGASIDTLDNALLACPEEIWADRAWLGREGHESRRWLTATC